MVIQSFGALQRVNPRTTGVESPVSAGLSYAGASTYAALYSTQPAVRTVVDFIARNIAQVGLHLYRRVSDTDRVRLPDHELAQWLATPNPDTTGYRLIEATMQDLGIYGVAYWLKVRHETAIGLVRVHPESLAPVGWLIPSSYVWTRPDNIPVPVATTEVVAFRYYNPLEPLLGLSPLETLRQRLAEDVSANTFRRQYWQNAARLEGVVTRPAGAPKWSPEQKQSFREQWQSRYCGRPGQTAVLEEGMTFTATSYSARESEFMEARKLTREEVAAEYHVPLPMVGILDHATFSNIREQHKHLYQDCLGPTFKMIEQELARQLLVECDDRAGVYIEANIAEKLKGSFEEQAVAVRTAVGRPWMTANEARGRMNLPRIADDPTADELALPLNMETPTGGAPDARVAATMASPIIRATWDRQQARLAKVEPDAWITEFNRARWDRELARDLRDAYAAAGMHPAAAIRAAMRTAATINADTFELLVKHEDAFGQAREADLYVHDTLACS